MEHKLNISAIELYSRKAIKPFLDKSFTGTSITGSQILKFCQIEQLNFFIIQQLFSKWHEETTKLKSPYFDFENDDVKHALSVFMGVVSQHIKISKEDFTPLLLQAVFNTIFYVNAPVLFLEQKHLQHDKTQNEDELKSAFKYLKAYPKFNDFYKSSESKWIGKTGKSIVDDFKSKFSTYYNEQEVVDKVMGDFNTFLPVLPSDFYYSEATKTIDYSIRPDENKPVSINELIGKEQKSTTLNLHTKNKIVDLRSAMSINQRFMFVKDLFKGDSSAFEGAMSLADNSTSYENAVNALIDNYSNRFGWIIDSDEVNELFDLIGRKFLTEGPEKSVS